MPIRTSNLQNYETKFNSSVISRVSFSWNENIRRISLDPNEEKKRKKKPGCIRYKTNWRLLTETERATSAAEKVTTSYLIESEQVKSERTRENDDNEMREKAIIFVLIPYLSFEVRCCSKLCFIRFLCAGCLHEPSSWSRIQPFHFYLFYTCVHVYWQRDDALSFSAIKFHWSFAKATK